MAPPLSSSLFCSVKRTIHNPASTREEKAVEKMQSELLLSAEIGFFNSCYCGQGHRGHFLWMGNHKHKHYWRSLPDWTHLEWHIRTLDLKTEMITPREYIIKLMKIQITLVKVWHVASVSFLFWGQRKHSCFCVRMRALSFSNAARQQALNWEGALNH